MCGCAPWQKDTTLGLHGDYTWAAGPVDGMGNGKPVRRKRHGSHFETPSRRCSAEQNDTWGACLADARQPHERGNSIDSCLAAGMHVDVHPGFTYELCAGLIDKSGKSNEEIASEVRWAGPAGLHAPRCGTWAWGAYLEQRRRRRRGAMGMGFMPHAVAVRGQGCARGA